MLRKRASDMMTWIAKTILRMALSLLDAWGAQRLTLENGKRVRAWIEFNTIERVTGWNGKSKHWAKLRSDNGFVQFMTGLMKSNRLTEFRDEK